MQGPISFPHHKIFLKSISHEDIVGPEISAAVMHYSTKTSKNAKSILETMNKSMMQRSLSDDKRVFSINKKEEEQNSLCKMYKYRQKGKQLFKKTFNKTKTDLDHNFIGKRYLTKIQQQKKLIKNKLKSTLFVRECKMCDEPDKTFQTKVFEIHSPQKMKLEKFKVLKHREKFKLYQQRVKFNCQNKNYGRFKTEVSSPEISVRKRVVGQRVVQLENKIMKVGYDNNEITPWDNDEEIAWTQKY